MHSNFVSKQNTNHYPARAMLGRDIRLFGRGVPAALVITVLLGLFCALAAVSLSRGADSAYTAAPVAVVDGDHSITSTFAVSMLSGQDFATPLALEKTSQRKAEKGLADGTYIAVLYLPEGYASDVMSGRQTSARLVVSENAALHADVVELLCRFGEELLSTGQFGIFVGEPMVLEIAPERYGDYLEKTNLRFLTQAFSDDWFAHEQVAYAGTGIDAARWYGVLYAAAFFQLLTLSFYFLSRDCTTQMLRRLYADGIGDGIFLLSKFLLLFGFYLLLTLAALGAVGILPAAAGLWTMPLTLVMFVSVGMALVICLPRTVSVSVVTALTAGGLFASGGIVPRMELPRAVTMLGDLLPLGAGARMIGCGLGGNGSVLSACACLLWTVLAWAAMLRHLHWMRKGAQL